MNFTRFPANTTNIFPIVNSTTGGQLLTEFNLRSRESIMTDENVKYIIGQSFTHSQDDFIVRPLEDELGTRISSTELEITAGRALVNGHYLESLTNVVIDLAEANNYLKSNNQIPLKGKLAIGLRAMYSTEQTLSASMVKEDSDNMMAGIQFVILPIGKVEAGYFVLPSDSPDNQNLVTAHLKLAEFYYNAGTITSIVQNENKTQAIQASRISDVDKLMAGSYVTRKGLNPKKLYTFSGKSFDKNSSKDTWCDSTDSLFIWQKASDLKLTEDVPNDQAEFGVDKSGNVILTLPHKCVDGGMFNTEGKEVFYNSRVMELPKASFSANTSGTVDGSYTKSVKEIAQKIYDLYNLPNGKQRAYVETITDDSREELPTLNQKYWNAGDYVLVRVDNSVVMSTDGLIQAPTTFYAVLSPKVEEVEFDNVQVDSDIPAKFDGYEIARFNDSSTAAIDTDYREVYESLVQLIKGGSEGKEQYNSDLGVNEGNYRGVKDDDYILRKIVDVPTPKSVLTYADSTQDENKRDILKNFEELLQRIEDKEKEIEVAQIGEDIPDTSKPSDPIDGSPVYKHIKGLDDYRLDYELARSDWETAVSEFENISTQINQAESSLSASTSKLNTVKANKDAAYLSLVQAEGKLDTATKFLEKLKEDLTSAKNDVTTFTSKKEQAEADKAAALKGNSSVSTIKDLTNKISVYTANINAAKSRVDNITKQMAEQRALISKYTSEVTTYTEKVKDLSNQEVDVQAQLNSKISELSGNNKDVIDKLRADQTKAGTTRDTKLELAKATYKVVGSWEAKVQNLNSQLNDLTGADGGSNVAVLTTWYAYYRVTKDDGVKVYSEPNLLTGTIPIATTDTIGGFYNVEDTYLDSGYVMVDETGHLKLLDYDLLRTGVLAYQLGQDREISEGLTSEEIQIELDEYINERVCFPNDEHLKSGKYPDMIELTINLGEETLYSTINIKNVDSRFGCGLWVHLVGECDEHTTVNFSNIEKLRLDITGCEPIVNVYNCGLYYDVSVIEYINLCPRVYKSQTALVKYDDNQIIYDNNFTGIENFSIWYKKFDEDEPNLIVDGMTVTETETPIIPDDIDYWSELVDNDNHYFFGLQSISFAPDGTIAGCGLYMRNDMTANVQLEKSVSIAKFVLPQGNNFTYPKSSLRRQVKVTGDFVTAYPSSAPEGYIIMTTKFTALSQNYTSYENLGNEPLAEDNATGTISFLNDAMLIENYIGVDEPTPVDGWESNSYHVFKGWTIA